MEFDAEDYDSQISEGGEDNSSDESTTGLDPISKGIETQLRKLASEHRQHLVTPETADLPEKDWTFSSRPPLLCAFAIVQYMLMVVSLDSASPDSEVIVLVELDMSQPYQWLWNALAIALPVNMARDSLWELKNSLSEEDRMEVEEEEDYDL